MTIACSDCGARQHLPTLDRAAVAYCHRCTRPLERTAGRGLDAALACSITMLILLVPMNALPLARSHLQNLSREGYLIQGALAHAEDGWPVVGIMVLLFTVLFPLARAACLTLSLGTLRAGYRPAWQGRVFRYAESLRLWSMPEVLLLAAAATYSRVAAELRVDIEMGGWCLIGAAFMSMLADGTMDRNRIWRAIGREREPDTDTEIVACDACALALPASATGSPCPRCAKPLRRRTPGAMNGCAATTLGAFILLVPAYVLPMTRTTQPTGLVERSIVDGIRELFDHDFWYLGTLVFFASVIIPLFKLVGLGWLMLRVRYPSARGLVARTKVYRVIHEINRWSFLDPFIVATTLPMMTYAGIADVDAGPGALAFAAVVTLTMLASRYYDPRLMWDAAGQYR